MKLVKLYIDNKIVPLKKKYKNFGAAINDITRQLILQNKVPDVFYVNGEQLKENSVVNINELKVIEVLTKTEGEMLLGAILNAKEQIPMFFDIFEHDNKDEDTLYYDVSELELIERGVFVRWFYNLLLLMKASGDLEFVYADFDEYIDEFEECMKLLENAFNSKDYGTMFDILEQSIGQLLMEFLENIDEYYKDILLEEEKKRIPN